MINKFGPLKLYTYKPTVIAEAGVNHGCNLSLAKRYIETAKKSGVDAIKFQTYKAELLAAKNSPAYWNIKKEKINNQFNLFKRLDKFNYKDYYTLYKKSLKEKITFMSTFFDTESVDKYDKLIKIYKISSSDINNIPLVRKIGSKKKHVIISTGAANIKEIKIAIKNLSLPKNKICIMHCVLKYPTEDRFANLNYIKKLKQKFPNHIIGYSDHTNSDLGLTSVQLAYSLGAQIIEKHFTHNKLLKGNDHYHSMDKKDLEIFNRIMHRKRDLAGSGIKNLKDEIDSIKFARRSLFAKKNIKEGELFSEKNLIALRPGTGISVSEWDKYVGKKSKKKYFKKEMIF